jgi:hypothetical protein
MKKQLFTLISIGVLANATTTNTTEKIIKENFNNQILPIIMKNLESNGTYTITLKFDYMKDKQIKVSASTPQTIYTNLTKLHKKGDYTTGYKYYTKYIVGKSQIKVTDFIKILGVKNEQDLDKLFKNNGELLLKKLEDEKQFYAIDGMIKIIKKNKLDDLKAFLKGVMAGKIPASCS